MRGRRPLPEEIYGALLYLFPARFRDEYGADLLQLVRDRRAELPRGSLRFWMRCYRDLVLQALVERASEIFASSGRNTRPGRGGCGMLDSLRQDLAYAVRTLSRTPGVTSLAVLTFALAVGANTAIFSVLDDVLLEPLPFGSPDALVALFETSPAVGVEKIETSVGLFLDWRERNRSFEDVTAWAHDSVVLQGPEESIALNAVLVYPNFFSVLELDPLFGRGFVMEDAPPGERGKVAIVSHALWRDELGADPAIVGKILRIDGDPHTVVAVMRADVAAPDASADVWLPASFRSPSRWERHNRMYRVWARLADGIDLDVAQQDLSRIAAELRSSEYADIYEGWDARVVPLHEEIVGGARPTLVTALGAIGLVLLIASVNIANLLLARGAGRRREMAVRSAIGAGRRRLAAQLLCESLVLAAAGGALGLAVAHAVHRLLLAYQPGILPRAEELSLDGSAFLFAGIVTTAFGLAFGLVPALHSARLDVQSSLQLGGTRGNSPGRGLGRARSVLVAVQLALATVLLCGAGLLLRTMLELDRVDPGFRTDGSVALRLFLDTRRYDSPERVAEYYARLGARLCELPDIEAAGASSALPMDPLGDNYDLPYRVQGQEQLSDNQLPQADFRVVTPGYFDALGIALRAGRDFDSFDRPDTAFVALVNETMARQVWPRGDAVGQRFETPSTDWHSFEVVGIVADTRYYGLRSDPRPEIYVAHAQVPTANMTFVVRPKSSSPSLAPTLRRAVLQEDPAQPTHSLVAMRELVSDSVSAERFYTLVLGAFAALALVLAASGVFGVLSYWVAARTQEIGIRMALGASRRAVVWSVVSRGLGLGALGTFVGLAAAAGASRAVESVLFRVSATDGATFAGVTLMLLTTAFAACAVPALRASRVEPLVALREE